MHVAAKVTLGIGVGMLVLGILLGGLGARGVGSATDWSVEEEAVWSGSSGVHEHTDAQDGVLLIFVSDEVRCDEFTLNVSVIEGDSDEKVWYTAGWCTEDGRLPIGYEDDPDGWMHMGEVRGLESGGSYEFVSEDNLVAVPEGVIREIIESVVGGFFGALGGGSCACCGLLIMLLGLILAFTMNEEVPTSYKVDAEGRIVLDHSKTGGSPESVQNSDVPDGTGVGSSEDTDAWYKQN
ncbi:MAG: hypothetical protein VX959_02670 [Candidatus Thermoplasmatota archaeon]|nr:hypothetical protein [Candidatus Thermoplasmatota archaeon]